MKLVSHGSFDRLQQALAEELIRIVKRELENVDAPSEMIEQLSGSMRSRLRPCSMTWLVSNATVKQSVQSLLSLLAKESLSSPAATVGCTNTSIGCCQGFSQRAQSKSNRQRAMSPTPNPSFKRRAFGKPLKSNY